MITTKHQALYNLMVKKGMDNPSVESGFEGDSLWVNETESYIFLESDGWNLPEDREDLDDYWGVEGEAVHEQDGWLLVQREL